MVLESLFSAKNIMNKPIHMLILSFVITVASIFISYFIFPQYAGIIFPLMITIAMAPLLYKLFSFEEQLEREEVKKKIHRTFFARHGEVIRLFGLFFIGNLLAVFLIMLIMPESFLTVFFSPQINEINAIRSIATGSMTLPNILEIIIVNNFKVMLFSFLLAFLIESGGVFILSWNASILSIYLANFVRQGAYAKFLIVTAGIFPHAVIEILAYFLAGIAGGILSIGILREKLGSKEFSLVFRDSVLLMGLAIAAVILGGFVEVYL